MLYRISLNLQKNIKEPSKAGGEEAEDPTTDTGRAASIVSDTSGAISVEKKPVGLPTPDVAAMAASSGGVAVALRGSGAQSPAAVAAAAAPASAGAGPAELARRRWESCQSLLSDRATGTPIPLTVGGESAPCCSWRYLQKIGDMIAGEIVCFTVQQGQSKWAVQSITPGTLKQYELEDQRAFIDAQSNGDQGFKKYYVFKDGQVPLTLLKELLAVNRASLLSLIGGISTDIFALGYLCKSCLFKIRCCW
jgi:hypothetical protein